MAPKRRATKKVTFSEENDVFQLPKDELSPEHEVPVVPAVSASIPAVAERQPEPTEERMATGADALTHVVVQLPISAEHVNEILAQDDMCNPLEYNPKLSEPTAYSPVNFFASKNDEFECQEASMGSPLQKSPVAAGGGCGGALCDEHTGGYDNNCKSALCFWCCHPVEHNQFGMPIRYDPAHNNFTFFGTFCSLECTSAYNFSVHMGSDRSWDVQSWIQIMARNYGISGVVRPAPSRYTLQMFDGPLTIDEFRKIHKGMARSVMVNIPPLVSMKPQVEAINTSFFAPDSTRDPAGAEGTKKTTLRRKVPSTETKKTLESKMNISCTSLTSIIETAVVA